MKTTSKKEASLALQDKIKALIIKQNLKSGDAMPTESELIEQLGVSRSSLREAIKSLEALHILDIRHGIGTFVSAPSLVPMIRGLSFHTQLNLQNDANQLLNILDIREILEYGFAPMVLAKVSPQTTINLQKWAQTMAKNAQHQKYSPKEEYQIHLNIYADLQNPLLLQYLDAFWQIYQQVEKNLPPNPISPEKSALQHRELVDAVEARDLVRLQQAILHYFQGIRARLSALNQAQGE